MGQCFGYAFVAVVVVAVVGVVGVVGVSRVSALYPQVIGNQIIRVWQCWPNKRVLAKYT